MRVLIDDQIFVSQVRGGVSRYFAELMKYVRRGEAPDVELVQPWRWTRNVHAEEAGLAATLPTPVGRRPFVLRTANRIPCAQGRPDVVHHTYYNCKYLRLEPSALRVVTVYDMIPEIFPELFPAGNPHEGKREFVEAADLVLCISTSTRDDLVRLYGVPTAPVVVTPLGVDYSFRPGLPPLPSLPSPYVLFVGNRKAYKDFDVLVEAFASLAARHADVRLVVVGGLPFDRAEEETLRRKGIRERVYRTSLSDSDLPAAYANASCFVFPSRYEGFGLPTVEAMAAGCPVILADSSAHPDVGGEAAVYFPPGDSEALGVALSRVHSDAALRRVLSERSLLRAAAFSWQQTGSATVRAYQQAMAATRHGACR